jgi:rubrerythrin
MKMKNRKAAIEWFSVLKKKFVKTEYEGYLDMAISALEKQEKKPAKAKFNKRYNKFVYFCPVCGEVTGYYDYCPDCGQAIDYDNPEPYTEEES